MSERSEEEKERNAAMLSLKVEDFAASLIELCPPGLEYQQAILRMQECAFWAAAGIMKE